MVFTDRCLHCDMHPGNVLVSPEAPSPLFDGEAAARVLIDHARQGRD
eukprot:gene3416-56496_t